MSQKPTNHDEKSYFGDESNILRDEMHRPTDIEEQNAYLTTNDHYARNGGKLEEKTLWER